MVDLKSGMKTDAILATSDPESVTSRSSGLIVMADFWTVSFGAFSVDGVPACSDTSTSISILIFLTLTLADPPTVIQ